jgi:hypothetical protein
MHEGDLDKLSGVRLQLEVQINTLESANINANTLDVMRRGANALKDIHNGLCVHPPSRSPPSPGIFVILTGVGISFCSLSFCPLFKKKLVWFLAGLQ